MNTTKNKYLNTLIIVFIIAIATLMLSSLMGGVNAVDISINNTNSTIQEAVNIISDGHDTSNTITLSNGTYLGSGNYNVNISSNTFNGRSLTIQGESKDGVIINAQGLGRIFIIRANNITLSNITFINGNFTGYGDGGAIANYGDGFSINGSIFNNNSAEYGGAIYNTGDNMSISGSSFNNNFADYGGAIYNWVANGFIVDNSVFVSNSAGIDGGVIENMYVYDFLVNNSVFVSNSAGGNGGVIDIYWSNNFAVVNSSFTLNNASHGGVIYSDSFNTSIIGSNIYDNYNGLNFTSATNATVNFNRFVNNTYTISGAGSGDNLSSNWWGQNSGIVAFINDGGAGGAIDYILDDYFVLLLNYSPNGNNAMVNSSFNKSKGNYVLSFYLALNTSNSTSMFNDTAYLLTSFNKTIVITNETGNTIYTPTANGFSSEALPLRNINRLIAIRALVDNEDLELSLLLDKPDYTDGLYVNSSWTGSNGDGSSWSSPFMNLSVALLAIVDNELNSNNCNFTIHIAGDDSTLLNNYTGDGVNVNLDLNSSYSNLTLSGEFGSPVFDGKSVSRIFNIGGSNITIANLIFINGYISNNGGAIYTTGNNISIINSIFVNNSANWGGGAIYNSGGSGFVVGNSSFSFNTASYGFSGGAIYNGGGSGFVVGNSSFSFNTARSGGAICILDSNDGNITYNRFVNNSASSDKAIYIYQGSNFNFSSNWFGSNNITGMIYNDTSNYILDDYFILLLNYYPNGNNTITNSSFNKSKGNYILSFYLALNTSNFTHIFNDTAYLLPEFNKTVIINNGTYNATYNTTANGFSSEALPLHYNNQLIAIRALADNEDLSLSLLLERPEYTNGLYVNSSWNDINCDGTSWDHPFINLKSALDAIVKYGLNSSNCNFTIHIAGDGSTLDYNYTGAGVNVNLDLNSSYSNLTLSGEFGSPVFDGKSVSCIFNIGGSNITIANLTFINGKVTGNGGAIYTTGNNISIINSIFVNNSANWGGGAIYNMGSDFVVDNSSFSSNTATGSSGGGAIYNYYGSGFVVGDSSFSFNTVSSGGGAIYNLDGSGFVVGDSSFSSNTASEGGAIYNSGGDGFSISGSNFADNSANYDGGAIENRGDNVSIMNSSFVNNVAGRYGGAICIWSNDDGNITYNRFVNNSASSDKAITISYSSNVNLSSNWFGSNNITGMIYNDSCSYVLEDYFVVFLKYLPSDSYLTSFDDDIDVFIDSYRLVYLFALNTSRGGGDIFNSTVSYLPDFDVLLVFSDGSFVNMSSHDAYYETAPFGLGFGDSVSINALVDNENLMLVLNVLDYSNGIYVNSSASSGGDGHNWSSAFTNLSDALNAIIVHKLNSSNCNFTIHIAGDNSTFAYNYTGDGVNVNLDLNSSYSNLTLFGEYGSPVFDGAGLFRIFNITGNNITLENIVFKNGASINNGGAIYNTGNNTKFMNSNFTNNSANWCGGAIVNYGSNFSLISSNFTNNIANAGGGAIYTLNNDNFSIIYSNFNNNCAEYGGAVFSWYSNFSINNSNFNNNFVSRYGGAIYNYGSDICIDDSNFNHNYVSVSASIDGSVYGGAVFSSIGDIIIDDSNFTHNYISISIPGSGYINGSVYGGGVYNFGGNMRVSGSNFDHNYISVPVSGSVNG
ncbi:MAG: hypothetical protein LBM96_09010, partial [Methanobrevibacter sp.]|nr:hypothetical protein [Candidatus Methanoflexus mossambicus]